MVTKPEPPAPVEKLLGFTAVGKSLADVVTVPAGYTALGHLRAGRPAGPLPPPPSRTMAAMPTSKTAPATITTAWSSLAWTAQASLRPAATSAGLLAVNHEATTNEKLASFFIHANGGSNTLPRPAAEVDRETALHGISVVEVRKAAGKWEYVKDSAFNRRVTCLTDCDISGPGQRQCAGENQVLDRRQQGPRHPEQLRHRPHARGAPSSPAKKTGAVTSPAAQPTMRRAATTRASPRSSAMAATRARPRATAGKPEASTTSTRAGTIPGWALRWTAATTTATR